MADQPKNYTPDTIPDQPFPGLEPATVLDGSSQGNNYTPGQTSDTGFPSAVIASQTISDSLDTLSKRILGEYSFGVSGALRIGKYENGVSGDLRLSPNGLTARNSSGVTTFAIDGTTGNATFAGTIAASTIDIGGADASSFHVDIDGNMWLGAASFGSAPFRVTKEGSLTANSGTFSGNVNGATIDIGGNDSTSFHVDSSGNMWLGDGSFGSAPMIITAAGNIATTAFSAFDTIAPSLIEFDERSSAPGSTNALYFYKNGVDYGFRTRMQSGNWQIDQTAV